jgi:hypothetical protein
MHSTTRNPARITTTSQALPRLLSASEVRSIAEDELHWFFTCATSDGESARARAQIASWLNCLPAFHRGAFALYFDRRPAPEAIRRHNPGIRTSFSFVLRMACDACPSQGTVEQVERAMVACLEAEVEKRGTDIIAELDYRAEKHFDGAFGAYIKARGRVPAILPVDRVA